VLQNIKEKEMTLAFKPEQTVKLSAGFASGSAVTIAGLGGNIRIVNYGDADAYVNLTQSFATATSANMVVMARTVEVFDRGWNTIVAAKGRTGDTMLDITSGEGV
jgi:hypothetical protein